jgi:hypothetical protein
VVHMLASGSRVRELKPGRSRWIFSVKKSSACLPSEGKLNNLSHVPTLRHVKEPISCGVLRADSEIPSMTKFPPSLAEGSHAAWCDAPLEMNEGTTTVRGRVQ